METLNLIKNDPWLEPYADAINGRHKHAAEKEAELTNKGKQTLSDFHPAIFILVYIAQMTAGCFANGRLMPPKFS